MTTQQRRAIVTTPGDTEIHVERVFDAPRDLVFALYTDPQRIPEWWGPRRSTTIVDVMDVRTGGRWRFIARDENGGETAFRGEYREVTPPERTVQTFEWEGLPGHIVEDTHVFTEQDGRTTLTTTSVFASTEDRDGMLSSGMEVGAEQSARHLDALLATWV